MILLIFQYSSHIKYIQTIPINPFIIDPITVAKLTFSTDKLFAGNKGYQLANTLNILYKESISNPLIFNDIVYVSVIIILPHPSAGMS